MLQPELKFRRDKIRYLMAQQGIDAALIACNVNLLYTYGEIVNGYLYLPLHSPALLLCRKYRNNYISLIISCICVEIFPLGTKWGQKYGKKNSKKRKSRLKNHIAD